MTLDHVLTDVKDLEGGELAAVEALDVGDQVVAEVGSSKRLQFDDWELAGDLITSQI